MRELFDQADHFLCHYSFVIDSYAKYCDIGCVYCYAKDFPIPERFQLDLGEVELLFEKAFLENASDSLSMLLRKRVPIRLGFETDPFQRAEKSNKVTYKLLTIFNKFNYPCIIFTKSTLILDELYTKLLVPELVNVQVSLSSFDRELALRVEPKAPSPMERLNIVTELGKRGLTTVARMNLLNSELRKGHIYENDEVYFKSIGKVLNENNIERAIFNYVKSKDEALDLKDWNDIKKQMSLNKVSVSYCYLGGKSFQYFSFNTPRVCENCCQCDLSVNDTRNSTGIKHIIRDGITAKALLDIFNHVTLKLIMRFISWAA
jgi:DNA repair photolyase